MFIRNNFCATALAVALVFAPLTAVPASSTNAADVSADIVQDDEPSDAERDFFTKGQNLFLQGQHGQAATIFKDFLKNYPNSVITDLILLWLGRSYMQLGQLPEAEQVGQRLRNIRETPFIDIYDSELQVARTERRSAPGATPNGAQTQATPTIEVAAVTPPPTRSTTSPTPNFTGRATTTTTPEATIGREAVADARSNRARRTTPAPPSQTPEPSVSPVATNNPASTRPTPVATPVVPLATPLTARTQPSSARPSATPPPGGTNAQVAVNNPPATRPPGGAPTPVQSAAMTSDPAMGAPVVSASNSSEALPPASSTGFSITVKQVPNLQLALRNAVLAASPGQPVQLPLVITNTGNKEDQFRIETDLPAEFQPTFSQAQGGNDTGLPILITPQLARGATFDVLLNIRIPESAPDNQQRRFIVRAASQVDNEVMRVADASLTVVAAALTATTGVSQQTVMPGETFTQTITVRNNGSAVARNARADFVFNPDFELVSANPSPLVYDRASRTAIWNLGELNSRMNRDISVTLRAVPDALAAMRSLGRGTMRTQSLSIPSNFDGPSIDIGRVTRARIDAVSTGLTATPGDTVFVPFVVRNPGNYAESFELRITAPGAPAATIFADSNGDGRHQESEPAITQTTQIQARGGQFPLLLRVEVPRNTPDRQQFAYNLVTRSLTQNRIAEEAATVLTVAAPRVRVRTELVSTEAIPGETIFYRLVLVNDGGGLAKNLIVTELLPDALEFVSSEPTLGAQDAAGGAQRFVWRVVELSPGDTAVLLVTVRLRANLQADMTLTPRHSLTYQDTNANSYTGQ